MQKYDEAVLTFTRLIELAPEFGLAYYNRAIIRERQADYEGACSDWRKSAGLGIEESKLHIEIECE